MRTRSILLSLAVSTGALCSTAAVAVDRSGTMAVSATLVKACEVRGTPTLSFGSFEALASSGVREAVSSDFQVACSADATPTIFSSTPRVLSASGRSVPFSLGLSAVSAAANGLGTNAATANPLVITQDGTLQVVPIYARINAEDYQAQVSGSYTATVNMTVAY